MKMITSIIATFCESLKQLVGVRVSAITAVRRFRLDAVTTEMAYISNSVVHVSDVGLGRVRSGKDQYMYEMNKYDVLLWVGFYKVDPCPRLAATPTDSISRGRGVFMRVRVYIRSVMLVNE